jgi:hypothetical protein
MEHELSQPEVGVDRSRRYDEAIEAFRQAIRIDLKHGVTWCYLGASYFYPDNKTAALDAIRRLQCLN